MLIDLHTHHQQAGANIKKHFNIIIPPENPEEEGDLPDLSEGLFSAGIHPWYIDEAGYEGQLDLLRSLLKNQQVKLLGECGIDKLKGPALSVQEEVFIRQIRLAEEFNKPLVLHVVRAFNELISIKKVMRPKVPMIIHGYAKKPELALQLIEKGFYLSLGADLLQAGSNAREVLRQMDKSRLFLETDDKDINITAIYHEASELSGMPLGDLEEQIQENYIGLFI